MQYENGSARAVVNHRLAKESLSSLGHRVNVERLDKSYLRSHNQATVLGWTTRGRLKVKLDGSYIVKVVSPDSVKKVRMGIQFIEHFQENILRKVLGLLRIVGHREAPLIDLFDIAAIKRFETLIGLTR